MKLPFLVSILLLLGNGVAVVNANPSLKGNGANNNNSGGKPKYEVWASDQSNSVAGETSPGVKGGFLWIWNSTEIQQQLDGNVENAVPMSCTTQPNGPCNLLDVFPQTLVDSVSGSTLSALGGFGRIHGVIQDPFGKYVTANMFAPGGGYVGVIDTETKQAVALFRVTGFSFTGQPGTDTQRSVHMSFWAVDGSAILVANLNGKAIERIDVTRNNQNKIVNMQFNKAASMGLGRGMSATGPASFFTGSNAMGNPLMGSVVGDYVNADLSDLTPSGACKENGCTTGPNGAAGGRPNNLPICPIASKNGLVYTTLAGGGLLILDITATPMTIVGEYGNAVVYGAGCGGVQKDDQVFLNAGVSASAAGATQSMFAVFSFDDTQYSTARDQNTPMPIRVFQDAGNTMTGGNVEGGIVQDPSGQLPAVTTRRDSHGMELSGNYLHVVDRIQNVIETFDVETYEKTTYDLTSLNGQMGRTGAASKCYQRSVLDDPNLVLNDPAPDLFEATPDGEYLMVAFRGPVPVSVNHAGQGSCPGVGIVQVTKGGQSGKLVDVLRTTNTIDTHSPGSVPGGIAYTGKERSDVHGAIVVAK